MKKKADGADFNELKNAVRRGDTAKLYVMTGDEEYLAENLVNAICTAVLRSGFEALDRVVLEGTSRTSRPDLDRLENEVATPAFASERRLVIVRNAGFFSGASQNAAREAASDQDDETGSGEPAPRIEGKDRTSRLIRLLDKLSDGVCLIFLEEKVDRRQRTLVEAVQRNGVLAVFERQKPPELISWLTAICRRENLAIDRLAAESLVDRCESSMRLIRSEMDKLLLYCTASNTRTIGLDLLEALSIPDVRGGIFELSDAIAAGRADRALRLLGALLSRKEPTTLIRFLLARHVRNLLVALGTRSDAELASLAGVPPFVASRLRTQARGLNPQMLEDLYGQCQENDWAVKTGKMADILALETLILAACERFRQRVASARV